MMRVVAGLLLLVSLSACHKECQGAHKHKNIDDAPLSAAFPPVAYEDMEEVAEEHSN